jgi:hypothetical protein
VKQENGGENGGSTLFCADLANLFTVRQSALRRRVASVGPEKMRRACQALVIACGCDGRSRTRWGEPAARCTRMQGLRAAAMPGVGDGDLRPESAGTARDTRLLRRSGAPVGIHSQAAKGAERIAPPPSPLRAP